MWGLMLLMTGDWPIVRAAWRHATGDPIHTFGIPVSRRMVNVSYMAWVVAFDLLLLAFLLAQDLILVETPAPQQISSTILRALNAHGLFAFLVANLLTGGVNLSVRTLFVGRMDAFAILCGYVFVVCALVVALQRSKIKLKVW